MTDLPKAKTRPASNWSAIWVLPLIALVIGGWLGWRAYTQTGIEIQVRFESGEGIQVNKTEVVYKGMTVGKVKTLALDDEGSNRGVIATIEMNKDVEQYLKANTRFWLVKPSVSLAGITGLETLVSGNYIAASPGDDAGQGLAAHFDPGEVGVDADAAGIPETRMFAHQAGVGRLDIDLDLDRVLISRQQVAFDLADLDLFVEHRAATVQRAEPLGLDRQVQAGLGVG